MVFILVALSGCSSPDGVVMDAVAAAHDGDREAFLDCFTGRSQSLMRALYQVAGDEHAPPFALSADPASVKIVKMSLLPPDRHADERVMVTVAEGVEVMGLVVHRVGSQWRIDMIDTERAQGAGMESILGPGPR